MIYFFNELNSNNFYYYSEEKEPASMKSPYGVED
jgi:hypothetical protein